MVHLNNKLGRTNGAFYANLRCHAAGILDDLKQGDLPVRPAAARRGLKRHAYERLLRFVADHPKLVETALATGDWSPIEEVLFARVRLYPHYPCYIDALVAAGVATDLKARPAKRGRPKGSRNKPKGEAATATPEQPAKRARPPKAKPTRSRFSRLWRGIVRLFGPET